MIDLQGLCPDRFEPVRDLFSRAFAEGKELGARFTAVVEGEVVLDLWGGWADRARTRAFDERTLTQVYSASKAVGSLMIAHAVDRGLLDYDQPLREVWPEFAQGGKGDLTLAEVLSHQSGLPGFPEAIDSELWFDWDGLCAALAAQAPLFPPRSASGYEPQTWGYLAGEAFRRVDSRGMAAALRQDWAEPLGLDLHLGLSEGEDGRAAELIKPPGLADFGEINVPTRAAFLQPWSGANPRDPRSKRMPQPATNVYATAEALARLMSVMACEGRYAGRPMISPEVVREAGRERIFGQDLVLPFTLSWAAGFTRNRGIGMYGPNPDAFGHSGWGGSCVFADPAARLSAAYVMNKQSVHLLNDPRPVALIQAAYDCL